MTDLNRDVSRTVNRLWYRAAFLIPIAGLYVSIRLGAWAQFGALFSGRIEAPPPGSAALLGSVVWIASVVPLLILAFRLGATDQSARTAGIAVWRGMMAAWRLAWTNATLLDVAARKGIERPDRSGVPVLWGLGVAALFFLFFLGLAPGLRAAGGVIWIGGAAVLVGISTYCRRRAMVYLREKPKLLDPLREWRLLNVRRYDPLGHRFVRTQQVCAAILPVWWLGGGALLMF